MIYSIRNQCILKIKKVYFKKKPKLFLEVGVFHGVTGRNVCEALHKIHGNDFKYIGLDLFEENEENINEIIPNTSFSNPLKTIYFRYIKRQNPYSFEAVEELLKKFKHNVSLIKGNSNKLLNKLENPINKCKICTCRRRSVSRESC